MEAGGKEVIRLAVVGERIESKTQSQYSQVTKSSRDW